MDKRNKTVFSVLLWLLTVRISESEPRIDEFSGSPNLIEYEYRYSVDESKTKGPVMDRWEHRIGEYVKGAYSVMEPDGRIRTVDYEVDGVKGYHAVIRMNEPGPQLLSLKQLSKSVELFPAAVLPSRSYGPAIQTRNARNDGKVWNYHSKTPYINGPRGDPRDPREAAATQTTISLDDDTEENLPLSPANFNVPQTKNLIHFLKPAAQIQGKLSSASQFGTKTVKRSPETEKVLPGGEIVDQRRNRNSKLVKRFRSIDEVKV